MTEVTDQAVREYSGLVESLATQLSRSPRAKQVGAEYDDLVQEGLIMVWQTLARRIRPSKEVVENRMKNWIRFLGKRNGESYATNLPLSDFRDFARPD